MLRKTLVRNLFLFCGIIFLIIGVIGIFIPLLPTTPFLLLTALCFNKGSEKFHNWLVHHKYFGPPIQDWRKRHVIRVRYKILATTMMMASWVMVIMRETIPLLGKMAFSAFLISLIIFIWTRKSK